MQFKKTFQSRENRIRRLIVSVFDLMSSLLTALHYLGPIWGEYNVQNLKLIRQHHKNCKTHPQGKIFNMDQILVISALTQFLVGIEKLSHKQQSPLYGRVTKKYDIYRNNNKKNLVTLAKQRLLAQKNFFYEVNFFHSLIKLNFSLI